jgi:hypothetical protein
MLTTHGLARSLFLGPDLPVIISSIEKPGECYAPKATKIEVDIPRPKKKARRTEFVYLHADKSVTV